jgi:hypothetical protein
MVSVNSKTRKMKRTFAALAIIASLVACNNSGTSTGDKKDSLDSVASEKKDRIDSSAEKRKDVVDSTTAHQKQVVEKMDSLNHKKDSATH